MNTRTKKILLIDDERELKNLISSILGEWDIQVYASSSAREALENIDTESPDLIIMDTRLPDINGYDLCKRLRTKAYTRKIPVVMIAIKDSVREKVKGLESGADDYITRPFACGEFTARIRAVLRSYQTV